MAKSSYGLDIPSNKIIKELLHRKEVRTSRGIWKAAGDVRTVIEYRSGDIRYPVVQKALITVIGSLGGTEQKLKMGEDFGHGARW